MDGLRQIMADLLTPEKASVATNQMKELKSNQLLLPALMQIALSDPEPQIRQMASVILRKETSKRFNSLGQADQAQLKEAVIKGMGSNIISQNSHGIHINKSYFNKVRL